MLWRVLLLVVMSGNPASAEVLKEVRQETRIGAATSARAGGWQGGLYLTHRSWVGWTIDAVDVPTTLTRGHRLGAGLEIDATLQGVRTQGTRMSAWAQGEALLRLQAPILELSPLVSWQRRTRVEERQWRSWRDQMGLGFEARASFESLSLLAHPFHLAIGGHTFRVVERRSTRDGARQGIDYTYEFAGFMYAFDAGREPELWRLLHVDHLASSVGSGEQTQWLSDMRLTFLSMQGVRWGALSIGGSFGLDVLEPWGATFDDSGMSWRLSLGQRTHLARDPLDPRGDRSPGLAWQVSAGSMRRLDARGVRVDAGLEGEARTSWRVSDALGLWALGFVGVGDAVARVDGGRLGAPMSFVGVHAGAGWRPRPAWMVRAMGLVERSERDDLWLGAPTPTRARWGMKVAIERQW